MRWRAGRILFASVGPPWWPLFLSPPGAFPAGVRSGGGASGPEQLSIVFWSKPDKERERFYLLPGQGGRGLRRKRTIILVWSIIAGLLVSSLLALGLYLAAAAPH